MQLSIIIPTYNRNSILSKNLPNLLRQVSTEIPIIILDNASDIPVKDTIIPLLSQFTNVNISFIRNEVNIGGNANLLKCIEICKTEWLWILSDDDFIQENAIEIIKNDIREYSEASFINYWPIGITSLPARNNTILTYGKEQFLTKLDDFGVALFVSSNIYNAKKIKPFLRFGHQYQMTNCAHFLTLLFSLQDKDQCVLSNKIIVKNGEEFTQQKVNPILIFGGIGNLNQLMLPAVVKKALITLVRKSYSRISVTPLQLINWLLIDYSNSLDRENVIYLFKKMKYDKIICTSFKDHLMLNALYTLIILPNLGNKLMDFLYKVVLKKPRPNFLQL